MKALVTPPVLPLSPPHLGDLDASRLVGYQRLGHVLRCNIFPETPNSAGAPSAWTSLSRDSYTRHPLPARPEPHLWFGYRTDEIGRWAERNFGDQKLRKTLAKMEDESGR